MMKIDLLAKILEQISLLRHGIANLSLSGDVTGHRSSTSVVRLQGRPVSTAVPTVGQVYSWNGSEWAPTTLSIPTYTFSEGITESGGNVTLGGLVTSTRTLTFNNGAASLQLTGSFPFYTWTSLVLENTGTGGQVAMTLINPGTLTISPGYIRQDDNSLVIEQATPSALLQIAYTVSNIPFPNRHYLESSPAGFVFRDSRSLGHTPSNGILYNDNTYRNYFVDTSLVDKGYVDNMLSGSLSFSTVATIMGTISLPSDARRVMVTGSVEDCAIRLPDATTLSVGREIVLISRSPVVVQVVNNSNDVLYRLNPWQRVTFLLVDNSSASGVWNINVLEADDRLLQRCDDTFFIGASELTLIWSPNTAAGGTADINTSTVAQERLGVITLTSGTAATGRSAIMRHGTLQAFILNSGLYVLEASIYLTSQATGSNQYTFYIGFGDVSAAGDMVDGVYFEHNSGAFSNFWGLKTAANNVRTSVVATGFPVVLNTWVNLRIEVSTISFHRATFIVNGVVAGVITTNIPSSPLMKTSCIAKIQRNAAGTNTSIHIDYINVKHYSPWS